MRILVACLLALVTQGILCAQIVAPTERLPSRAYESRLEFADAGTPRGLPAIEVRSRNGALLVRVQPAYRVSNFPSLKNLKPLSRIGSTNDQPWTPVYGERSRYPNRYEQIVLPFAEEADGEAILQMELRLYEEGVAWRIVFPRSSASGERKLRIESEDTVFQFPDGTHAWATYRAQAVYERVPLAEVRDGCERPLTLELPDGSYAALAEAGMDDFSRMKFGPAPGGALRTILDSTVEIETPYATPWRVLILGNAPGELIERNYLLLNLNEPSKIEDTSWIKPGKVMREVTLSTKGGKKLVDFAVAHNIQFIEYDAGWYGHEYDENQDARTVTPDPDRTGKVPGWGGLNLQEVIDYATSKDIGVILYVNRRHLEKQIDELLPLYKSWGVSGLKYGFVNVGSQQWSKWLHNAVRKAAEHRLMVDIHDEYRPTGLSRTWPNLMTQEGILGNEAMPDATHNMTLPFTRGVAGAGDYTICYFTPRIKTTHPHQLALAVIMYSPWQFVFWYDKPSDFQAEPEMRFFEQLPSVWDDTRVLRGAIGEYISVARRKGDNWWLATATNNEERSLTVPLNFLDLNRRYVVEIYEEPSARNSSAERSPRTNVAVRICTLASRAPLRIALPPSGGHAAVFRPMGMNDANLPACGQRSW